MFYHRRLAVALILLIAVAGCGQQGWKITAENKSDAPASFHLTITRAAGGSSEANFDDVAKGRILTLMTGTGDATVAAIKVTHNEEEQNLTPNAKLKGGTNYAIVVGVDGKAIAPTTNK